MRRAIVLGCLLMVGVGFGGAAGEPHPPEWTSAIYASAAARQAKAAYRISGADTLGNPYDYEVMGGYEDDGGWLRGKAFVSFERENGRRYIGKVLETRVVGPKGEIGWNLADLPDDGLYANRFWYQRSVSRFLAIGATQSYFAPDFGRGHAMLRIAATTDGPMLVIWPGVIYRASAVYETSWRADRIAAKVEILSLITDDKRYALIPEAAIESQRDNGHRTSAWRAKGVVKVGID
jgi:hypothetical protein